MNLIKGFKRNLLSTSLNPNVFHLILFPTEQCNFRCVYCYEDFNIGAMEPWLIQAIKQFLETKIPQLTVLSLNWFGGEPLLAKNILFELAEYAFALAKKNNVKLKGDLTTNGLLLDVNTLTRLVELKQTHFQISIDGDAEHHDTTRITRTGKGSFDKIWNRLLDASNTDLDFTVTLRIHVTALNQASVHRFCKLHEQHLKYDKRFKLFFKAIEDLGGEKQEKLTTLLDAGKPREVAAELQQQYAPIAEKGKPICYAAKPNSLAIRANGNLNKCTVALKDDHNHIGKILPDGKLEVANEKFSTWLSGFEGLDAWKLGCPHSFFKSQQAKSQKAKLKKHVGDLNIPIIEVA
ncbi:radical SAM protein [uncultured Shewanella sp.]|uniref:radical SAM protein n=1 Tax=uncultured Shewanella sp. TaxID=173975 RepID=UPI00261BF296|nr:radical SAM protein [uncultured Shewanella sp.]